MRTNARRFGVLKVKYFVCAFMTRYRVIGVRLQFCWA